MEVYGGNRELTWSLKQAFKGMENLILVDLDDSSYGLKKALYDAQEKKDQYVIGFSLEHIQQRWSDPTFRMFMSMSNTGYVKIPFSLYYVKTSIRKFKK